MKLGFYDRDGVRIQGCLLEQTEEHIRKLAHMAKERLFYADLYEGNMCEGNRTGDGH
jgi:hypothetical protein